MIDLSSLTIDDGQICTKEQRQELDRLLSSFPNNSPSVEQLWQMMDEVWDGLGCDNQNLDWDRISTFYSHPIWILNGLFVEQDEVSIQHRQYISDWINRNSEIKQVVDYGGGMGILAQLLAENNPNLGIDIYEPYPSQVAIARLSKFPRIKFINELNSGIYDCLVSTDVLEHVSDPLPLFAQMIDSVKLNGFLIIVNCFHPIIKCHLPTTFHLRYTFKIFAKLMGLKSLGVCTGNRHAMVYQKRSVKSLNWQQIERVERLSRAAYPMLNSLHQSFEDFKRFVR